MKLFAIFAKMEDSPVPIDVYGYCKTKAAAIGELVTGMHDSVSVSYPDKYGHGELDIEMSGINYFPDGLSIKMSVREKQTYHTLCDLTGFAIMVEEIKPEEEEE